MTNPAAVWAMGAAVLCSGCGDQLQVGQVRGTVTCNGKPAYGGTIYFRPVDDPKATGRPPGQPGQPSHAVVHEDGSFELTMDVTGTGKSLEGALTGRHDVIFEPPRTKPAPIDPEDLQRRTPEQLQTLRQDLDKLYPVYQPIPCGRTIAPQEAEVKAGENAFSFTLSK